jgi:hypothetical protein
MVHFDKTEKIILVVIFIIAMFAVAAFTMGIGAFNNTGNSSNNNANNQGANSTQPVVTTPITPTVNKTVNKTVTPVTPVVSNMIKLSGNGDNVTKSFNLTAGDAIFTLSNDGSANFAVWLDNSHGNKTALLANTIGPYTGSKLQGVTDPSIFGSVPGSYYLDITSNGNWTATIVNTKPTTGPGLPQTFTGTTDNVTSAFTLTSGAIKFDMTYNGTSNFAVWLYDANGNMIGLLANEIGSYSGAKSQGILTTGTYYLAVTGVGSWSITASHM